METKTHVNCEAEKIAIEQRILRGEPCQCLVIYDDAPPRGTGRPAPMLLDNGTRAWLMENLFPATPPQPPVPEAEEFSVEEIAENIIPFGEHPSHYEPPKAIEDRIEGAFSILFDEFTCDGCQPGKLCDYCASWRKVIDDLRTDVRMALARLPSPPPPAEQQIDLSPLCLCGHHASKHDACSMRCYVCKRVEFRMQPAPADQGQAGQDVMSEADIDNTVRLLLSRSSEDADEHIDRLARAARKAGELQAVVDRQRAALADLRRQIVLHENHYADTPGGCPRGWDFDTTKADDALAPSTSETPEQR